MGWIPIRTDLWNDGRVLWIARNASVTVVSRSTVIGALFRLWALADEQTTDGHLVGWTTDEVDRECDLPGLCEALMNPDIDWLAKTARGLQVQRFQEHNGQSAKARIRAAGRQDRFRGKAKERNAPVTVAPLPTEQKRTEEKRRGKTKTADLPFVDSPSEVEIPRILQTDAFREAWADWLTHRKEIHKVINPPTARNKLRDLAEWGPVRAVTAIRCSIGNGWVGIFEPKEQANGHAGNGKTTRIAAATARREEELADEYSGVVLKPGLIREYSGPGGKDRAAGGTQAPGGRATAGDPADRTAGVADA